MQTTLKHQLKNGDLWYENSKTITVCMYAPLSCRYLVDIRWMKQWKKYVGYDTWDQSSVGKESANPGPLDNFNLFKSKCPYIVKLLPRVLDHTCESSQTLQSVPTDGCLREDLMDELDYYLLPKSAWNKLASWYGLSPESKAISRWCYNYIDTTLFRSIGQPQAGG